MRKTRATAAGVAALAVAGGLGALTIAGVASGVDPPAQRTVSAIVPVGPTATGDGADRIRARVTFRDTGRTLTASGVGAGFVPGRAYMTLLYDAGSSPTGNLACVPSDDSVPFDSMVIGLWTPVGSAVRRLEAVTLVGSAYVPLSAVGTASVRRIDPTNPPTVNLNLQSCGAVGTG